MIIAPFALTETVVATKENPVTEGPSETIWGSGTGARDDLFHHCIMDHLPMIRHVFVLLDGICHKGHIINGDPGRGEGSWQLVWHCMA
jgi:hypothetical protein